MKKHLWSLLCVVVYMLLALLPNTSKAQVQTAQYASTCSNSNGFYEYLPQGYNSGSQTYPLIVFIHGVGELGNGSSQLPNMLNSGFPAAIKQGKFPSSFTVNGQTFSFIVISPQFVNWPSPTDVESVINYAVSHYRVNTNRIYLTGLSMGGGVTWDYAGNNSTYANKLAAIVPICGASGADRGRARTMAAANLPVWAFHNSGDGTVPVSYTDGYVSMINEAPAPNPPAKKTIFQASGHDAWTPVYTSSYTENGMNAFQWMLQYSRNGSGNPNQLPMVNGGGNQTITLPVSSVTLNGSATDPDGSISSYAWSQVSGAAATITNVSSATTNIVGLNTAGTRVFRLTATDNRGGVASNDVTVTVNGAANQAPVAKAGNDQTITLPTSSATLSGSGTDADGTIASYVWSQLSGTAASISNAGAASTNITGLTTAGTRVFRLTVTDNQGAKATSDVSITVNNASTPSTPGATRTINVNLYGTAIYNNSAWNNWNTVTSLKSDAFKYSDGSSSAVSAVLSAQSSYADNGPSYPVSVYPQQVGRDASWNNASRTLTLSGLDNNKLYDLGLFASRSTADQTTRFVINGVSRDIATYNNYTNIASFNGIAPSSGNIVVTISQLTTYNYLNAFTLTEKGSANEAPKASAGSSQSITLPTSTVTLSGSGTDADGSITSYAWTQVSGTAATIANASSATTNITGLNSAGTRVFRLTVTDNSGATASSDVTVTVNAANAPAQTKVINVNLYGGVAYNNAAWNNWNIVNSLTSQAFKYSDGTNSTITSVLSAQGSWADNGDSYSVTMCPKPIGRETSWATGTRTNTITGLDNNKVYDIQLYASRTTAGQTTRYTINGVSKDVATSYNTSNAVSFTDIVPSSGKIVVTITQLNTYNYLNGFTLTEKSASGQVSALSIQQKEIAGSTVDVFPNPVQDRFALKVDNELSGTMNVQIIDMNGNLKKQYVVQKAAPGITQTYLSIGDLAAGEYILSVKISDWVETSKIIKQ